MLIFLVAATAEHELVTCVSRIQIYLLLLMSISICMVDNFESDIVIAVDLNVNVLV